MNEEKLTILENIKEEAIKNYVPILQDVSLELIEVILSIKKPNKILEIGTAVGYSAINFSKYLVGKDSKIKTIEINEKMYHIAKENIQKMGLDNKIEIINEDATKYLETINEDSEQFDVIFIDAAKGQYLIFLENAIRLAKNDAVIIADNVYFHGRVLSGYNEHRHRTATNRLREYIRIINEDKRLKSIVLNVGDGVAISVVKK
ncbi:MAG: O-methyltransferase [Clostridia bacterium]|nr:O-methyltransferase [Clostridia bacterium]